MRFAVEHETLYRYSASVGFGPHLLRMNPRLDGGRLVSRVLRVTPVPVQWTEVVDDYGNQLTRVAFQGQADALRIESRFELETATAPALPSYAPLAPLPWPSFIGDGLDAYRAGEIEPQVRAFADALAWRSGGAPLAFLAALTADLHGDMDRAVRVDGAARSAATTLATRQGACRDITVLFLAACRAQGLPARFVSGYQAKAQTPDGQFYLHAWAEVHLPGFGWRGWDPTHGVVVTDGHVALCAAPDQAATMPVEGGFWGPALTATLDTSVRIETGA